MVTWWSVYMSVPITDCLWPDNLMKIHLHRWWWLRRRNSYETEELLLNCLPLICLGGRADDHRVGGRHYFAISPPPPLSWSSSWICLQRTFGFVARRRHGFVARAAIYFHQGHREVGERSAMRAICRIHSRPDALPIWLNICILKSIFLMTNIYGEDFFFTIS